MPFVELRTVSKSFGRVTAVREVSLSAESGELLTLLGPSGCGKTTTLSIIAGFVTQDAGDVLINGKLVNTTPSYRRNTGMVFQNYALFPHMTVAENIAFGLTMRRVPTHEKDRLVKDAVSLVRLESLEERYPRQLSGGQQQRVALARALAFKPDVLLLDEPLSNLDAKLRQEMRAELSEIRRRVGITTVFVTHDQQEALEISDRVAVMRDGLVMQVGSPEEIYERPADAFVATFVGESNLFEARVVAVDRDTTLLDTLEGLRIRAEKVPLSAGERVNVLVRPHRVRIEKDKTGHDGANTFVATVRRVAYMGDQIHVLLDVSSKLIKAVLPTVGEASDVTLDEQVTVSWLPLHSIIIKRRFDSYG